jgi:peptidoglycan hydrolase FlgJ
MSAALTVSPDLLRPAPQAPSATAATYGADATRRARIAKTAQDFEASFTSIMLGQMFEGVNTAPPFGGGEAEGMMKSFLTDAIAKQIGKRGGFGLSTVIQREMLKMQGLDAQPAAAAGAATPAKAAG